MVRAGSEQASKMANHRIALLIVTGGLNPNRGRWIDLCLRKLQPSLQVTPSHVYIWNNDVNDHSLRGHLANVPWVTYLEAAPYEHLAHPHAVPLQRLYSLARDEGAEIIVTMDSDAHPLRPDWLMQLVTALQDGAALAGVWRDELSNEIAPYIHPSCLASTVDFIEQHNLRFDRLRSTLDTEPQDTLSHFTRAAQTVNLPVFPLRRSNVNNFHRLLGGVYGDLIYHHGAGARRQISFWDEPKQTERSHLYDQMRDAAAERLFTDYEQFLGWLQGKQSDAQFERKMQALQQCTPPDTADAEKQTGPIAVSATGGRSNIKTTLRTGLQKVPGVRQAVNIVRRRYVGHKKHDYSPIKMLRPIGLSDLHDIPAGWAVTGPAFIGVGTPKSGTTWWHNLIIAHPQVVPNRGNCQRSKELHYFVHFQSKPMNAADRMLYHQFFAAPPGAIAGEFSTSYLAYPNCIEQVAQAEPDAKILVMLRNPIDRMLSHLNHMRVNRTKWFADLGATQGKLLNHYSNYCEAAIHSLYAVGLRRLFRCYGRGQVLVLQYERCRQDPAGELARTYRFLGLDDAYLPSDLRREVNVMPYVLPRYSPEERQLLTAYFADDVAQTVELCPELELKLWRDFVPSTEE